MHCLSGDISNQLITCWSPPPTSLCVGFLPQCFSRSVSWTSSISWKLIRMQLSGPTSELLKDNLYTWGPVICLKPSRWFWCRLSDRKLCHRKQAGVRLSLILPSLYASDSQGEVSGPAISVSLGNVLAMQIPGPPLEVGFSKRQRCCQYVVSNNGLGYFHLALGREAC